MADDQAPDVVRYSVKELLADIRGAISALDTKLDAKADRADLIAIAVRIEHLEKAESARQAAIRAERELAASAAGTLDRRHKFIYGIAYITSLAGGVLAGILGHFIGRH